MALSGGSTASSRSPSSSWAPSSGPKPKPRAPPPETKPPPDPNRRYDDDRPRAVCPALRHFQRLKDEDSLLGPPRRQAPLSLSEDVRSSASDFSPSHRRLPSARLRDVTQVPRRGWAARRCRLRRG
mmetsp:Transcript_1077/g.3187  ORF Transcript_1077/g.3187 Transcript_1077/m.3187 type:complete len:126 (+) Transcript_1077:1079-1456(+)